MSTLVRSKSKIKELLRKWQSFKHTGPAYEPVGDGSTLRKTKSSTWNVDGSQQVQHHNDDDEVGESSSQSENSSATTADDVPAGHLAVYVGRERRRFVIDAHYLNNTLVRGLIEKSGGDYDNASTATSSSISNASNGANGSTASSDVSTNTSNVAMDRHHPDGLTIACEVVLFEHLLWLIENNDPEAKQTEGDELLDFYKY